MASLTRKIIKGRAYYYLRECQRIDGRPKIVHQQYIGSAERVAELLAGGKTSAAPVPRTEGRPFGALAALYGLARELDISGIVDRAVGVSGDQALALP